MKTTSPLKLAAQGLDERTLNLFRLFLRGPGSNRAVIVDDHTEADAFLADLDSPQGKAWYAGRNPSRPCIVLALGQQTLDGDSFLVSKPARTDNLLSALEQVRSQLRIHASSSVIKPAEPAPPPMKMVQAQTAEARTHRVAMLLDEQAFGSYMGRRDDVDPNDATQREALFYKPEEYLQGVIQKACAHALTNGAPIRVNTPWKSLCILSKDRKIWVDADEAQLRAACGIPFRMIANLDLAGAKQSSISFSEMDPEDVEGLARHARAVPLDALLWKIVLWTSKGRIPQGVELDHEVHLTRWPNFTRLLVTPHAMRIAALLQQKPCTLFEAAQILSVRQQYVFAFFSAAWAAGLVELTPNTAIAPTSRPEPAPERAPKTSLLKSILQRLKIS